MRTHQSPSASRTAGNTRDRMLDAAAHVIRTQGLARATTKEIARASGYSEAALYKYFRDKTDLFLAVLSERVPSHLEPLLKSLLDRAGEGSISAALEQVARAALDFYGEAFPMAASLFADPDLLASHIEALHRHGRGPQKVNDALAALLLAEQRCGRIRQDVDPEAAAALLLGACFQQVFLGHFAGPQEERRSAADLVPPVVHAFLVGLTPAG